MTKKIVQRRKEIGIDYKTINEVSDLLSRLSNEMGGECVFDIDFDECAVFVIQESEETDNEYNLRVKLEKLRSDKDLDSRKAQYEKLKLEFDA